MSRQVVTLNAGSSSIKFALFDVEGTAAVPLAIGLAEMLPAERRITVHDGKGVQTHTETWSDAPSPTRRSTPPATASSMAASNTPSPSSSPTRCWTTCAP